MGRGFVFQQDNNLKHTLKLCKKYVLSKVKQKAIGYTDWPPHSPDLNLINVRKVRPINKQLWEYMYTCWNQIFTTILEKFFVRISKICATVINVKEGYFEETKIA